MPWHVTVAGPLSARNAIFARLRDLKRGGRYLHFTPAFLALSRSDQNRAQDSPKAIKAYFAAFWLKPVCHGANSPLIALKRGLNLW